MTRVQADIRPVIIEWLGGQNVGAEVRGNVPDQWTVDDGPLLVVEDDGGPVLWPVKAQYTIRITSRAAGRTEGRRIVSLAAGLLATERPCGIGRDMSGILGARDETTGAVLASVLLTAQARTVEV